MSTKKIIAITGATGAQGRGLAHAILNDPNSEFAVRAVTRNPDSDKAKALAELDAEVVKADLDDVQSLTDAFKGAYGAFCLTNFWEHFSPDKEKQQAANMAEAAKDAGLEHVIWSTLEDTRNFVPLSDERMPTLMEHYKVPHFDAKGEANQFFTDSGVPTTFLNTSFYWDNFIYFGMGPKKGEDGNYAITLPMADKKLAGIAAEDIGKCAYGILKAGSKYKNQTVGIAGGHLSGKQMAESLSKALGTDVHYNAVSPATYRSFGFPGAEDLGNMFQFNQEFSDSYCNARDLQESLALNPELLSLDTWLDKYKGQIPLE
jgi:uncharacterized protein YbjT (DUF2867 family)